MPYLIFTVVFVLMLSVGMSLRPAELMVHWRRHDGLSWLGLFFATFLAPTFFALLLARLFHLKHGEAAGLFLLGVAPGAPLLVRNVSQKGFDLHIAAGYQLWSALLIPVMIPIIVYSAGKLYGREIWIAPAILLHQVLWKQLLPVALGMVLAYFAPNIAGRCQRPLALIGNVLLAVTLVLILIKIGAALKAITLLVPLGTLLLAGGSLLAMLAIHLSNPVLKPTLALCNVNRHVGLALLLGGQYVGAKNAIPTVVCYALIAPLVMFAYARFVRRHERWQRTAATGSSGD